MSEIVQPLRFGGVLCLHDQLASLARHAQLTRCFSAVAELLVFSCRHFYHVRCMRYTCIQATMHLLCFRLPDTNCF